MVLNKRGLTLLEILLSITILGILGIVVASFIGNSILTSNVSQERMSALFAAQNCIEESRITLQTNCSHTTNTLIPLPATVGENNSDIVDVTMNSKDYNLRKEIILEEQLNGGNLYGIKVTVSRPNGALSSNQVSLKTRMFIQDTN